MPSVRYPCERPLTLMAGLATAAFAGCGVGERVDGDRVLVVSPNGTSQRQLTRGRQLHRSVVWSPDGRRLAWVAMGLEGVAPTRLALELSRDGEKPRRLELRDAAGESPGMTGSGGPVLAWSPNGSRLAFADHGMFVITDRDLSLMRRTRIGDLQAGVAWSPDGRRIAFVETRRPDARQARGTAASTVVIANARGEVVRRMRAPGEIGGALSWSSDGRRLAFSALYDSPSRVVLPGPTSSPPPPPQPQLELIVASPESGIMRRVTRTRVDEYEPTWRPGGQELLVRRRDSRTDSLWVLSADGRRATRLVADAGRVWPQWSPDGRRVLAAVAFGGRRDGVYLFAADGRRARRLARQVAGGIATWSPEGKMIAFADYRPGQGSRGGLRLVRRDGSGARIAVSLRGEDIHELAWAPNGGALALVARPTSRD